jgi:hypothetical protein
MNPVLEATLTTLIFLLTISFFISFSYKMLTSEVQRVEYSTMKAISEYIASYLKFVIQSNPEALDDLRNSELENLLENLISVEEGSKKSFSAKNIEVTIEPQVIFLLEKRGDNIWIKSNVETTRTILFFIDNTGYFYQEAETPCIISGKNYPDIILGVNSVNVSGTYTYKKREDLMAMVYERTFQKIYFLGTTERFTPISFEIVASEQRWDVYQEHSKLLEEHSEDETPYNYISSVLNGVQTPYVIILVSNDGKYYSCWPPIYPKIVYNSLFEEENYQYVTTNVTAFVENIPVQISVTAWRK